MFSFVRRPEAEKEVRNKEVTEVPNGFSLFFTHGHLDRKREDIRKSLEAFEGEVFSSATYKHKLEMEIHFPSAESKAEWFKHAKKAELISE